jgi:hypothetical protein
MQKDWNMLGKYTTQRPFEVENPLDFSPACSGRFSGPAGQTGGGPFRTPWNGALGLLAKLLGQD